MKLLVLCLAITGTLGAEMRRGPAQEETATGTVAVDCSQQACIADVCWDGQGRREIDGKCCQCPSDPNCFTKEVWSQAKKTWCCKEKKLGCENSEDSVRDSSSTFCRKNPGVCTKTFCSANPLTCRSEKLKDDEGKSVRAKSHPALCCNPETESHGSDVTTCSFGNFTDETGNHDVLQVKHKLTGRHNSHRHRCARVKGACRCCECKESWPTLAHACALDITDDVKGCKSLTAAQCEFHSKIIKTSGDYFKAKRCILGTDANGGPQCKTSEIPVTCEWQALKHACALKHTSESQECSSLTAAQCESHSKIVHTFPSSTSFNVKRCILMRYKKGDPKCKMSSNAVKCDPASLAKQKICENDENDNERAYKEDQKKCVRCGHRQGRVACVGGRCDAVDEQTGAKMTYNSASGQCVKCGKEGWLACGGDTCDAMNDTGHKLHVAVPDGRCTKCGHLNGKACGGTLCDDGLVVNDNQKCKENR